MRILVVEDEEALAERIAKVLRSERYQIELAFDGVDGLDKALVEDYDAVILDILLPRMNGIDVLRALRAEGRRMPILLLTAKDTIDDKVQGLDAGADDYLTKPFALAELLARLRSLLRRTSETKSSTLQVGELEVDTRTHETKISGKTIQLTPKEYAILEFLLYNKNRVLSRLSIAEHVWGDNFNLDSMTNFVDVHVKNLRRKLGDDRQRPVIQSVRGVGYLIKDEA